MRTDNGVVVIDATSVAQTLSQDNSQLASLMKSIEQSLSSSTGFIIDTRSPSQLPEDPADSFEFFLRQLLPTLLDTSVALGTTRYRMHNGYATQTGRGGSFYYSGLITAAPQTITSRRRTKALSIAFIINENTPNVSTTLSGLQSAKRAVVIREGEQGVESDSGPFKIDLPENVKVQMRTLELINPDGSIGLQPDASIPRSASEDLAMKEAIASVKTNRLGNTSNRTSSVTGQISQAEKPYADMQFPTAEYRLLALFRFWNVINYFYPYRKLIGDSWGTVLQRYIPKFEANKNVLDYQLTVRELVTEMHDSHGGVRNAKAAEEWLGDFTPPIIVDFIENHTVVTKVLDDKSSLKVGDTLLTMDGQPIEKRVAYLSLYLSASTPQWLMKIVHALMLFGPKDSAIKLSVKGIKGETREVEVNRSLSIMDPKLEAASDRTSQMVQVLPSGYGYVDLQRLQVGDVNKMFETIKNTPAVIFDMRGYPNGTAWPIAPRLTEKKNVVAALFSRPFLEASTLSDSYYEDSASYSFAQKLPERNGDVYKGKVVMLINGDAISQSEHTCMFFEAATDVTFVGTPTAGANGDVTFMVLPGNLQIGFTGHNVRHADGRQLQRAGIQPTIRVAPTIRGISEGRDEVLERAIKYLQENLKH